MKEKMYAVEEQQLFVDEFNRFYETANELFYNEYLKRCDGVIDCQEGAEDAYHDLIENELDELANKAKELRLKVFDTNSK